MYAMVMSWQAPTSPNISARAKGVQRPPQASWDSSPAHEERAAPFLGPPVCGRHTICRVLSEAVEGDRPAPYGPSSRWAVFHLSAVLGARQSALRRGRLSWARPYRACTWAGGVPSPKL